MPRRSGRSRAASAPPGVGLIRALEWNHRAIKCVAFDPTLRQLAGGGLDGTVALWDTIEGKLVRTFERRRSPFECQRNEIALRSWLSTSGGGKPLDAIPLHTLMEGPKLRKSDKRQMRVRRQEPVVRIHSPPAASHTNPSIAVDLLRSQRPFFSLVVPCARGR